MRQLDTPAVEETYHYEYHDKFSTVADTELRESSRCSTNPTPPLSFPNVDIFAKKHTRTTFGGHPGKMHLNTRISESC